MKPNFKYKKLSIDKLRKAPWNYKNDDSDRLEKLKKAILKRGQIVNLIVRPIEDELYEVVNGNHRFDALCELGIEEAQVCDIGPQSQEQAELIAIETNELNFETDKVRLSKILKHIADSIDISEIVETTPYDMTEVNNHIRMVDFNFDDYGPKNGDQISPEQPSDEPFKTLQLNLPESVYKQFQEQLLRMKKALYPDQEPDQVANVAPTEAMLQIVAQTPDDQLI